MEKMFFRRNGTGAWFRARLIASIALQNESDLLNSVFWLRSPRWKRPMRRPARGRR